MAFSKGQITDRIESNLISHFFQYPTQPPAVRESSKYRHKAQCHNRRNFCVKILRRLLLPIVGEVSMNSRSRGMVFSDLPALAEWSGWESRGESGILLELSRVCCFVCIEHYRGRWRRSVVEPTKLLACCFTKSLSAAKYYFR